jgi:hypothetical protein
MSATGSQVHGDVISRFIEWPQRIARDGSGLLAHSVALFAMYYNFVRIHKTLRTTPAMAAKVTERLWEMSDIVGVLEACEATN